MTSNGPTRSENTNRFIRAWLDTAEGRLGEHEWAAILEEREQGLHAARVDFARRLDGERPDFVAAIRPFALQAEAAFARYAEGLDIARAWSASRDQVELERGLKLLREVGDQVLDALSAYDMAVLAHRGPTTHALLNGLVKACSAPDITAAQLMPLITQARTLLQSATEDRGSDPAVARLRAGAPAYLEALAVIERGDRASGAAMIADTATRLEEAATLLREGAQASGPTLFPLANALLNTRDDIRDGRIPPVLVDEVLTSLEGAFARLRPTLSRALRTGSGAMFADEAERAKRAMALHEQAVGNLRAFLETGSTDDFDRAMDELRDAVQTLQDARAAFEDMADREGKTVCVWCSTANTPGNANCVKCGRMLPRWMDDDAQASTFAVDEEGDVAFQSETVATENLQRLVEAAEMAACGDLSPAACLEVVNWLDEKTSSGIARLDRLRPTPALDQAREALAWMRQGLEQMRRPLEAGDPGLLDAGLRTVQEGAHALHEAQRLASDHLNVEQ